MSNNLPAFYQSLQVMGFGMVGNFIVLSLIYVAIKILIKVFPEKSA